jgi:hypothetical protein
MIQFIPQSTLLQRKEKARQRLIAAGSFRSYWAGRVWAE